MTVLVGNAFVTSHLKATKRYSATRDFGSLVQHKPPSRLSYRGAEFRYEALIACLSCGNMRLAETAARRQILRRQDLLRLFAGAKETGVETSLDA